MRQAVLFLNLGSPDSPSIPDVRRYLAEFLMDPYVLDMPIWRRFLVVYGLILPVRPRRSAAAYARVWMPEGSPLLVYSRRFLKAVQMALKTPSYLAMRYGKPGIPLVIRDILADHPNLEELVVFPLYPQYAESSFKTAVVQAEDALSTVGFTGRIRIVPPFFSDPACSAVLADRIRPYLTKDAYLLISFHGLPVRHLRKADPTGSHCMTSNCCNRPSPAHAVCYRHQCLETARLVTSALGLSEDRYGISFQSRLGRDEWLLPSTESEVKRLPQAGVRTLVVASLSFVADCLETLEEIDMGIRSEFLASGGTDFTMVPALNDDPAWVRTVACWLQERYGVL